MEFTISKTSLQKELGLVQGTVEKKNTIPALSNILIESVGEGTIRITGTDLDVTLRWATDKCERSNFRIAGIDRDNFPEVPSFKSAPVRLPAGVFKTLIDRTIFAITLEESRYTLSGAKFMLDKTGARMVTTDGHRLAYIERKDLGEAAAKESFDTLIPRKTLAEVAKLTASHEGE